MNIISKQGRRSRRAQGWTTVSASGAAAACTDAMAGGTESASVRAAARWGSARLADGRRLGGGEEGSSMVEMAVSLPIVFLIMTGIFNFSTVLFQKMELAEAVASAGRVLAVDRGDTDPCKTAASALYGAAPSLTQGSITLSFNLDGVTTSGASCAGSGGAVNPNMVSGANAMLTATYPCTLKVYGKTFSSCSLSSQITEVVQ